MPFMFEKLEVYQKGLDAGRPEPLGGGSPRPSLGEDEGVELGFAEVEPELDRSAGEFG